MPGAAARADGEAVAGAAEDPAGIAREGGSQTADAPCRRSSRIWGEDAI